MEGNIKVNGITFRIQRPERFNKEKTYKGRKSGIIIQVSSSYRGWWFFAKKGSICWNSLWGSTYCSWETLEDALKAASNIETYLDKL